MAKNKNKSILDVFTKKEVNQILEETVNEVVQEKTADQPSELSNLLVELFISGALENDDLKFTQKQERIIEKCLLAVLNEIGIEASTKGIRSSKLPRNIQNALISCLPKKGK